MSVHAERIEGVGLPKAGLVTARALAPLPALLGLAAPLLDEGGVALFPKGARAGEEIEAARREWRFEVALAGSQESPVLVVSGLCRG